MFFDVGEFVFGVGEVLDEDGVVAAKDCDVDTADGEVCGGGSDEVFDGKECDVDKEHEEEDAVEGVFVVAGHFVRASAFCL